MAWLMILQVLGTAHDEDGQGCFLLSLKSNEFRSDAYNHRLQSFCFLGFLGVLASFQHSIALHLF